MAFYAVMRHDTRDDTIHIFKCATASDPNTITNWTSQATYVLDGPIKSIWTFVHSSDIYITVAGYRKGNQDNFGYVKFLRYDVGTDTIDIDEEQVDDNDALPKETNGGTRTQHGATVAVRSDGDIIVLYSNLVADNDSDSAVSYSRRESGTWTRGVAVAGVANNDISGTAVLGASDRIHFFFKRDDLSDVLHRSLSSANALGATTSTVDAVAGTDLFLVGGVSFNDGTARVRVAYEGGNGQISSAYGNDVENPTWTIETNASDNDVLTQNNAPVGDMVLDGQKSHLIYSEDLTSDIFIDENDGIGGWGTDTEDQDAVTCNALSANTYDRSGQKLAYLWDDAGTTKYDEVDIDIVAAGRPPLQRIRSHAPVRASFY